MKTTIPAIEKVIAERTNPAEYGINTRLFWAYKHSIDAGNDYIDFSEPLWDEDIEPIVNFFKKNGIKEFTISCKFSSLILTLALFDALGCTMAGITDIKETYTDFKTNEKAVVKAIRMVLK